MWTSVASAHRKREHIRRRVVRHTHRLHGGRTYNCSGRAMRDDPSSKPGITTDSLPAGLRVSRTSAVLQALSGLLPTSGRSFPDQECYPLVLSATS